MLVLLSPSKKLESDPLSNIPFEATQPRLKKEYLDLVSILKKKSVQDIAELMALSDSLAQLNYDRYQKISHDLDADESTPAIFTFKGDVYDGLRATDWNESALNYAQDHLRILSGLYGLLCPYDAIEPYRLEMGSRLKNEKGKNLYAFWGEGITDLISEDLNAQGDREIINLASNEYFKAVKPKLIQANVTTIHFKDYKNGNYKSLMLYVKRARGAMAREIMNQQPNSVDDLKSMVVDEYKYHVDLSSLNDWVYTRGDT